MLYWLSRVDEWRIDGEAAELDGNLLECGENRVWWRGREELGGLDYESGEHGGKKTRLWFMYKSIRSQRELG